MDPTAGDFSAPGLGASSDIFKVDKALALKEAFPDVPDRIFHNRFVPRMVRAGGIRQETAEGGIFQESAVETRNVRICQIQTGFEAIDHDPPGAPLEKPIRLLEAIDDGI